MKEAIIFYCFIAATIGMYLFGQQDNMEDVVKDCQQQNQFIVDGKTYQCYSFDIKEEEEKKDIDYKKIM
jgi:hypothetical protein